MQHTDRTCTSTTVRARPQNSAKQVEQGDRTARPLLEHGDRPAQPLVEHGDRRTRQQPSTRADQKQHTIVHSKGKQTRRRRFSTATGYAAQPDRLRAARYLAAASILPGSVDAKTQSKLLPVQAASSRQIQRGHTCKDMALSIHSDRASSCFQAGPVGPATIKQDKRQICQQRRQLTTYKAESQLTFTRGAENHVQGFSKARHKEPGIVE